MTGWDFMDEYSKFPEKYLKETSVFIVTSSIAEFDVEKAKSYPQIQEYITKPMTGEKIIEIAKRLTAK